MNEEQANGSNQEDRDFVAERTGGEESTEANASFAETAEMLELRQKIVEAGKESEQLEELMRGWKQLAEVEYDRIGGSRPRIEAMILEADLWEELGVDMYRTLCLNEASDYAEYSSGCEDLFEAIKSKLN